MAQETGTTGTGTRYAVRQGDVLLIKVDRLPDAPERHATRGNHLLALGEQTGHAHYVSALEAAMLEANDAMQDVARAHGVAEADALLIGGVRVTAAAGTTLWHGTPTPDSAGPRDADHAPIALPEGDYLAIRPREYQDDDEFRVIAD